MKKPVEVLAEGLGHPEGPYELADGRVVFANTYRCEVSVWEEGRGVSTYAATGGAPNACMLGADGHIYITMHATVAGWVPPDRPQPPSIQRADADGNVEIVCTEVAGIPLIAPNDLTFGPDRRLYFTDSGDFDPQRRPDPGYIFAIDAHGTGEVIAETGHVYPNGVVAEADGSIVWVESYTRKVWRRRPDGETEELHELEPGHVPDGLKVSDSGDLWITSIGSGGVDVIAGDGRYIDFLDVGGIPLNCVFASDGTLLVCDAGPNDPGAQVSFNGRLLKVDVAVHGMPLFEGVVAVTA